MGLGIISKLKLILKTKKNPILLTILTENMITLSSTMIPLICQILHLIAPTSLWSIFGGIAIGVIQMFF